MTFIATLHVVNGFIFYRFGDLMASCRELDGWTADLDLPSVVWLPGFFNPQSFLTGEATVSTPTLQGISMMSNQMC